MSEFLTLETLLSFPVAVMIALLIPNVVMSISGQLPSGTVRAIGFGIALVLAYLKAWVAGLTIMEGVLAFFNAIVIYAAAYGINAQVVERQITAHLDNSLRDFQADPTRNGYFVARAEPLDGFFKPW